MDFAVVSRALEISMQACNTLARQPTGKAASYAWNLLEVLLSSLYPLDSDLHELQIAPSALKKETLHERGVKLASAPKKQLVLAKTTAALWIGN